LLLLINNRYKVYINIIIIESILKDIKRKDIKAGNIVKIVEKENQKTGKLTKGIVKKILTSSSTHPYGIKVILDNDVVGRVKEIIK
jgi:uncharacterized repeat protein (TIGR03833 family)